MKRLTVGRALLGMMAILLIMGIVGCERPVPDEPTPTLEVEISPQAPPTREREPTTVSVLETPSGTATATIFWDVPTFTPTPEGAVSPTSTPPVLAVQPTWTPTVGAMPTEPSPASVSHTVVWGDTLFGLAQRYGTTVDAIVRVNNLPNENYIRVGQVLQIPRGDQPVGVPAAPGGTVSYTVQPGDTLYGIASRYGTTVQAIAQANGVVNPAFIRVGQQLSIPTGSTADVPASPGGNVYVVVPGDTLSSIAARYGTTAWAIAYANNLPNANWIRVGQTLIIPAP